MSYSKGYCNHGFVFFFQTELSINAQSAENDMECHDLSVKVRVYAVHILMLQSRLLYLLEYLKECLYCVFFVLT